jgi:uncharacterized protein (DUF433 family)
VQPKIENTTITYAEDQYIDWEKTLVIDPEIMAGETVFPNSRLTVRRVASLLEKGESETVILEDYPYLNDMDLEFAKIYSERHYHA